MNENEKKLAEKILAEAAEAPAGTRSELIGQYDQLMRSVLLRKEIENPRPLATMFTQP